MIEKQTILGIIDVTPREYLWDEIKRLEKGLAIVYDEKLELHLQIYGWRHKEEYAEQVKAALNRQINELRDENARLKEENTRLQEKIDML